MRWLLRAAGGSTLFAVCVFAYMLQTADADQDATIPMSSNAQYDLNHMNSQASKWRLGYLVNHSLDPSGFQKLSNGQILVGNGSNVGTAVTPSGDLTMSNSGAFTLNGGGISEATGTLTQAQILSMSSVAVTLVASPAAGKVLVPIELELQHVPGTVYASGGAIQVQYLLGNTSIIDMAATVITGSTGNTFFIRPSAYDLNATTGTGTGFDMAAVSGSALQFKNLTQPFISGSSTNVVNYRFKYRTLAVP